MACCRSSWACMQLTKCSQTSKICLSGFPTWTGDKRNSFPNFLRVTYCAHAKWQYRLRRIHFLLSCCVFFFCVCVYVCVFILLAKLSMPADAFMKRDVVSQTCIVHVFAAESRIRSLPRCTWTARRCSLLFSLPLYNFGDARIAAILLIAAAALQASSWYSFCIVFITCIAMHAYMRIYVKRSMQVSLPTCMAKAKHQLQSVL